jgi:SAM-dependent methyltransferase
MSLLGNIFGRSKPKAFDRWERTPTAKLPRPMQETRRYLTNSNYLLPKDREEELRLNFQHYALFHALGNHYTAPLSFPIRTMLDVGTGTGIWAIEMAHLCRTSLVIGVDLDEALFKADPPDNCVLRAGNVLTGLPFPDQLFDYTHQRLLVLAIPAEKWPGVIHELVRVTRPGGWLELVEADTQIEQAGPATTHLQGLINALVQGEPIRHLGEMLSQEGLQAVETQPIPLALGDWGGRVGSMLKRDVLAAVQALKGPCCQRELITPEAFERMVSAMAQEWEVYRSSCTFYAVYGKRGVA